MGSNYSPISCLLLLLLPFLFLVSCLISHVAAASNITQGQSIRDGQNIISSGGEFELGFFSPANSTKRYVGIWYYKIPVRTVVWIANRENPVLDSSGVFTVGTDGNLKVLDGQGASLWSTNISSAVPINSTAVLADTGNLILCRSEEAGNSCRSLWKSFDYPTDTYLPGMRVGINRRTRERQLYRSWKSETDPSSGNFSLGFDPFGQAQIVIYNQTRRYWRSGLWNGQIFVGVPKMRRTLFIYGFRISTDNNPDGEIYFTYSAFSRSDIMRFRIRWDGREEQLRWDEPKREWSVFWSQPTNVCEIYNSCGAFATCSSSNSQRCNCLRGFEPKFIDEWNSGNWSGGCVRRTKLQCERNSSDDGVGKADGFLERNGVKLPDFSAVKAVEETREQCEAECLKNCSCHAYAHGNGLGCLTWTTDLRDIEEFEDGGFTLYIRVANSELDKNKKSWKIGVVIAAVVGASFLVTSAYLYWQFGRKGKGLCRKGKTETLVSDVSKGRDFGMDLSGQYDIGEEDEENVPELPLYSLQTVATATNNFSDANLLGQGGFGPVYKGKFPCGMEIAVKRLSRQSGQGLEEFRTEVKLIARLQHRNLVRLLGCCTQGEERMLIYEYLPNKSLDAFIFEPTNEMQLDWSKRFNIIEGIARGLLYLHRDSRLRVIHRDLKASNILLDEEMNPKISDFGMAKIFGGNQNQANTNRLVGTYGYMSPEYAMEGLFSVKSDVYSFGVLLLEIVSGKRNTQYRNLEHSKNLLGYAWKLWSEAKAIDLVDPSIRDSTSSVSDVVRCIHIGLLCVQDSTTDRPTMSSVVLMLASETTTLPLPKEPTFTVGSSIGMDLFLENSEGISKNDVTVTMVVGR